MQTISRKFLVILREPDSWDQYIEIYPDEISQLKLAHKLNNDPSDQQFVLRYIRPRRLAALSRKLKPWIRSCEIYDRDHRKDNGKRQ
jgi:hypothetical protein